MKLLVIGHSVIDRINLSGRTSEKPGGIFYTVAALIAFTGSEDSVFLCTAFTQNDKYLFAPVFKYVKKDYLAEVDAIPVVNLLLRQGKERLEQYESITDNLKLSFDEMNKFDGILINMITGFDISVEQLQEIKRNFSGLIYFDVHTLSRGLDENLNRNFRTIPEFGKWASCIDILQANKLELKTLFDFSTDKETIYALFSAGVKQVIVTEAENGASVYTSESEEINEVSESAINVEVVNKIGCGDVFGAVYFYNYIQNKSITEALKLANIAAGISTTYFDADDYLNLKSDVYKQHSET
jgi:sugar/nucleoside kinase (ribokinase family)